MKKTVLTNLVLIFTICNVLTGCGAENDYENNPFLKDKYPVVDSTLENEGTKTTEKESIYIKETEPQTTKDKTNTVEMQTEKKDTTLSYPLKREAVLNAYKEYADEKWGDINNIPYILISVNENAIPICIITVNDYFPTALAIEDGKVVTIGANECYNCEYLYNATEKKLTVHGADGSFIDYVCYRIDENGHAEKYLAIQRADWGGDTPSTFTDFMSGDGVEIDAAIYENYMSQIGDVGENVFPNANCNKMIDIDK